MVVQDPSPPVEVRSTLMQTRARAIGLLLISPAPLLATSNTWYCTGRHSRPSRGFKARLQRHRTRCKPRFIAAPVPQGDPRSVQICGVFLADALVARAGVPQTFGTAPPGALLAPCRVRHPTSPSRRRENVTTGFADPWVAALFRAPQTGVPSPATPPRLPAARPRAARSSAARSSAARSSQFSSSQLSSSQLSSAQLAAQQLSSAQLTRLAARSSAARSSPAQQLAARSLPAVQLTAHSSSAQAAAGRFLPLLRPRASALPRLASAGAVGGSTPLGPESRVAGAMTSTVGCG